MTRKHKLIIGGAAAAVVAIILAQILGTIVTKDRKPLKEFTSEIGRFTIQMPPAVRREHESIDTKLGMLESTRYGSRSKFVQFLVIYYDYPPQYMRETDAAAILKGAAEGIAGNVGGTIKKQEAFIHNGTAAREVKVKAAKGLWLRSRVMLVGPRLYQLMALSNGRHINDRKIDDVFDSFQLIEQPEPEAPEVPAEPDSSADSSVAEPDTTA